MFLEFGSAIPESTTESTEPITYTPCGMECHWTTSSSTSSSSTVTTDAGTCHKYIDDYNDLASGFKNSFYTALTNDIDTYSKKPGKITRKAKKLRNKWKTAFDEVVDSWMAKINNGRGRGCLVRKFPNNAPGSLGKDILGDDCALDMNSIDSICENLKVFLEWNTEECSRDLLKVKRLDKSCEKIKRIRNKIRGE